MHDVLVVGGGPGGLYTATLLARSGFDVVVLEEHDRTGEPVHCTGVLASEAFDEFGLSRDSILNPLSTARFYSPSGLSVSYTTPRTEALVVDRARFDQDLDGQARTAGATVTLGTRVTGVEVGERSVAVHTRQGELHGRACVLACGANYVLHRQLGLGMPVSYLRSAQLELRADSTHDVEVHFGHDVAPHGFAWIVPVERGTTRHARVGLMCQQDSSGYFRRFVERHLDPLGLHISDAIDEVLPRQKMLPLAPVARTFANRVLAVGDAAGLVKATTGGGIYYSLVSASIAAQVLAGALANDTLDAGTLSRYQRRWRKRLGAELDAQGSLRELAERLDDDEIDALFDLAQTNGVMPIVRRTARFNQHRDLIVSLLKHPPARRLLFKELVTRAAAFPAR